MLSQMSLIPRSTVRQRTPEVALEAQNDVGKNVGKTKNYGFFIGEMAE
jgi:hypothetical protein